MDATTVLLVAGVGALAAVVVILVAARSRRERALEPVRLGPSWSPEIPDDDAAVDTAPPPPADREARARTVMERTGLDRQAIDTVLNAWDEYLAVIGVVSLPVTHRYKVYDPYDPPVPERGPNGPIPDPVRVARDVSYRTAVAEVDASTVFDALFEHGEAE